MDAGCLCVAGAALGGPQSHFAWQVQHSEHLTVILCGKCSTWRTSLSFCAAGAALGAPPERSAEVRRRLSTMDAGCAGRVTWRWRNRSWSVPGKGPPSPGMARAEPWRRTGRKAGNDHWLGFEELSIVEISLYDNEGRQQGRGLIQLEQKAVEDEESEGQRGKDGSWQSKTGVLNGGLTTTTRVR